MSNNKTIIYNGNKYEFSNFEHPGEGICGAYLSDYKNKDATEEIDHYHYTNRPFEILEKAKVEGEYEGLKYLGQ